MKKFFVLSVLMLFSFITAFAADSVKVSQPIKTEIKAGHDMSELWHKIDSLSKDSLAKAELKKTVSDEIATWYEMPKTGAEFTDWIVWILKIITPIYFLIGVFVSNKPTEKPNRFWQLFQILGRFFIAPPNRNKEGGTH